MVERALLALALLSSVCGMAWLALAMDVHWKQIGAPVSLEPSGARRLRALGALSLTTSLVCCLLASHATIAVLVWVMALSASALLVAFGLAWRPRWLALLVGRRSGR